MPGPVSDSYDPEFGTGENADEVRMAVEGVREIISEAIGDPTLRDIVQVAAGPPGAAHDLRFSERQLRVMRFALNRALESL